MWPATLRRACCFETTATAFTERGLDPGVALNEDGREQGGMGLGIGDFITDGYIDIFKTHFSSDTRAVQEQQERFLSRCDNPGRAAR